MLTSDKNKSKIYTLAVCLFLFICYNGCIANDQLNEPKSRPDSYYHEAGIKKAIEKYYGDSFGQIVTYDRPGQYIAVCVITVTMPRPAYHKVWLSRKNDREEWQITNIAKNYPYGDE